MSLPQRDDTLDKNALKFLDGLRGLAAFYVVVGHARWLLWEGFSNFQGHNEQYVWWDQVLAYGLVAFRYGHEAVLFFFVLSGFVIHLRYAKKWREDASVPFDWLNYLKRRVRRIYPPFLLSLVLAFLLVLIGRQAGFSIYRAATPYPLINQNIQPAIDFQTLLGNLGFLMGTYVPVFGTNGPLWSLKYEWWFYMVYPLSAVLNRRNIYPATVLVLFLFMASFSPAYWPVKLLQEVASLLLSWWLGVLLAEVWVGRIRLHWGYLMLLTPVLSLGLLGTGQHPVVNDTFCALGFMGLLAFCFWLQIQGVQLIALDRLKWLGDCSYTLYIVHFPVLVWLSGWVIQSKGQLPAHFWYVMVVILAWLLHFVVEKPFVSRK
jgi:peptidoglycan/LPS O-acetylase OafA/YrhL